MSSGYTLDEIAGWVGGRVRGDGSLRVSGVATIAEAGAADLTWATDSKYARQLAESKAGAVLGPDDLPESSLPAVLTKRPASALITVLEHFAPPAARPASGVDASAVVAPNASLGDDITIGPQVVIADGVSIGHRAVIHANVCIGPSVVIGDDCELWPGVVIRERCRLGNRVTVHANTTIGADGFGYEFIDGQHVKVPQIGAVEIEDDVEIGANCAIDRAKVGVTRIGRGTKIDNLVQVAHNVQIGPNCVIVAQAGLAGSIRLGQGVVLGGQVGIKDHTTIGDGAQVGACACVAKDVPPGARVIGMPAIDGKQFAREQARLRRLPEMAEQLRDLIKRVQRLETAADD